MTTSADVPGAAWSAGFASAQRSAMDIYAQVMVPRMFEPWGRELLSELAVKAGEAVLDVACGPGWGTRLGAPRGRPPGGGDGVGPGPPLPPVPPGPGPGADGAALADPEGPSGPRPRPQPAF